MNISVKTDRDIPLALGVEVSQARDIYCIDAFCEDNIGVQIYATKNQIINFIKAFDHIMELEGDK